jgi:hypothetical protein
LILPADARNSQGLPAAVLSSSMQGRGIGHYK